MRTRQWLLNALTAAILVGLGACGGGGGDDNRPTSTIDITTGNVEIVAHSVVAGVWGLSLGVTAPLAAGSSISGRSMSAWLQMQSKRVASASAQRERPLEVIGPIVESCDVIGTRSVTWDDRDGDRTLTVGDILTGVFTGCQDIPGETTNGTMTITALSSTLGRIGMTQLSFETAKHSMTLNGSVLLEDVSADTLQTTAEGPVTVAVLLKHLTPPFNDDVTLLDGFVARLTIGTADTVSTFNGLLESRGAGGVVQVATATNAPIRQYAADDYAYAGTVQVKGMNSTLQMTVLSTSNVRLDLDADGNGSFESTETVAWDWLL